MHRKNSMEVRLVVEHEHEAQRGPRRVRQSVARVSYYTRVGLPIFRFREEEDPASANSGSAAFSGLELKST